MPVIKMKFLVYYINSAGEREGVEIIEAANRSEAKEIYRTYFNVKGEISVIPRLEVS